jgi:ribonuclease HI
MTKPKPKFYVVWKGRRTGVFDNWADCNEQVKGFAGAVFKSFNSRSLAEQAFAGEPSDGITDNIFSSNLSQEQLALIGTPVRDSIAVDAAWNTFTKVLEYRGVMTATGVEIFRQGPFENGTINIGEFLAIVHALAHCRKHGWTLPIYSDSRNAIMWVRDKQAQTELQPDEKNKILFELVARAEHWLRENNYENEVLKWETEAWGENPADFGRK